MMSYSIIGVVWAVEDNYGFCKLGETREISNHEVTCTSWMVYVARLEWYVTDYEIVLRCTFFILHFFALLYIRDSIRKTYAYHDERDTSLSDFAIVIENIPEQKGLSKKLKEFFQSYFGKPMQVPEIILLNYLN